MFFVLFCFVGMAPSCFGRYVPHMFSKVGFTKQNFLA